MHAMEADLSIVSPRQVESGLTTKSIWNDYQNTALSGSSNILQDFLSQNHSTEQIRKNLFNLGQEDQAKICQGALLLALSEKINKSNS